MPTETLYTNQPATDDADRVAELDELALMYSEPEAVFDRVTAELAKVFDAPAVMMNLIDCDTQYIKSFAGVAEDQLPQRTVARKDSICGYVVGSNQVMVVEDLAADPRFKDNPIVKAKGFRFYAGAPLRTDKGHPIGALCVVDNKPRCISDREKLLLKMVADALMTEVKLRKASRQLLERTRVIERDLAAARMVQRFLLPPSVQSGKGFAFKNFYQPAEAIGGDFIDSRLRPDGSLAWMVADVSGHGASAALTSVMVKTIFQHVAPDVAGPAELLTAIERDLSLASESGQFVTAAAGVFCPVTRTVSLASAGHPMPVLLRDGRARLLETVNDLPLLIEPLQIYSRQTVEALDAGDRLVFYTDGVTEASDPDGNMLGVEGFIPMLEAHSPLTDGDYLRSLFHAIRGYAQGRLKDDVALVCLEVH
jgi:serine phosphatase RsbU (regulator of sigma subunit)